MTISRIEPEFAGWRISDDRDVFSALRVADAVGANHAAYRRIFHPVDESSEPHVWSHLADEAGIRFDGSINQAALIELATDIRGEPLLVSEMGPPDRLLHELFTKARSDLIFDWHNWTYNYSMPPSAYRLTVADAWVLWSDLRNTYRALVNPEYILTNEWTLWTDIDSHCSFVGCEPDIDDWLSEHPWLDSAPVRAGDRCF